MAKSIKDAMTTKPASLPASATVADAAQQMRELDIGDVLVEQEGRLAGIVTDRDIVVRAIAEGRDITSKLGDIVSSEVVCITPAESADDAIRLMRERALRRGQWSRMAGPSESSRSATWRKNAILARCSARSAARRRTARRSSGCATRFIPNALEIRQDLEPATSPWRGACHLRWRLL